MALESLSLREDVENLQDVILSNLNDGYYWKRYFFLRLLNKQVDEPVIGEVLRRLDANWLEQVPLRSLKEFIRERSFRRGC
jgi:hypothetical protein